MAGAVPLEHEDLRALPPRLEDRRGRRAEGRVHLQRLAALVGEGLAHARAGDHADLHLVHHVAVGHARHPTAARGWGDPRWRFDAASGICKDAAMRTALPTARTALALAAAGSTFLGLSPASAQPAAPGAPAAAVEPAVVTQGEPAWTVSMDLRHLLQSPVAEMAWDSMQESDNIDHLKAFEEKTGLNLREDMRRIGGQRRRLRGPGRQRHRRARQRRPPGGVVHRAARAPGGGAARRGPHALVLHAGHRPGGGGRAGGRAAPGHARLRGDPRNARGRAAGLLDQRGGGPRPRHGRRPGGAPRPRPAERAIASFPSAPPRCPRTPPRRT